MVTGQKLKKTKFWSEINKSNCNFLIPVYSPDPVLHLQLDKSICQVWGGAQDKKFIPGYSKNVYWIALQNFVFLSFWLVTKMNYHLPLWESRWIRWHDFFFCWHLVSNLYLSEKFLVKLLFLVELWFSRIKPNIPDEP